MYREMVQDKLILMKAPYIHLSIDSASVTNNTKLSGFTKHMIIISVIYLRKMSIRSGRCRPILWNLG